jgi:predicted AlkP superfamily pyrophosphatase or phosphodiesterase
MKKIISSIHLLLLFVFCFCCSLSNYSQKTTKSNLKKPKLIIGIVVDQMRYDYIFRYWDKLSDGGFKRLINKGFFCKNTNYNYVPTYTGPGHASIFTGSFPAVHGIIANEWYDKSTGKLKYCTEDATVKPVGSENSAGYMSPKNLLTTTIGDELRLNSIQQSKVIAVSLKDRASILPAGHSANAAYWFDGKSANFISSTHYVNQLPEWLINFNNKKLPQLYLEKGWNTILPIQNYYESTTDNQEYELSPNGKSEPVFPYDYAKQIKEGNFDIIRATPHGNTITKDLAIAALNGEQLGKSNYTDMLCVSFSSTDYVGHSFGPKSIEIEDTYLRLDLDLQEFFTELDKQVGKNNYLLFLTADHGAAEVPAYLNKNKIPGGLVDENEIEKRLKEFLYAGFGDSLVLNCSNQQVFLDHAKLSDKKIDPIKVQDATAAFLLQQNGIAETYKAEDIKSQSYAKNSFKALLQNGYHFKRSGDVLFRFPVAFFDAIMKKGTTHGAEFSYDTHVPLFFMGWNIPTGSTVESVDITDIAPTICTLLNIPFPNGCVGKPIEDLFEDD